MSVGSLKISKEEVDLDASLLSWAEKLHRLDSQVDQETSDYMLKSILQKYGNIYHKFEYEISQNQENELRAKNKRAPTLKHYSILMTQDPGVVAEVEMVLKDIVKEKFSC